MVELLWVPSDCGVEGNEISDALEKEGLIPPMPVPKAAIGMSVASANTSIKNWKQTSYNGRWQSVNAAKHIKLFLSEPDKHTAKVILSKTTV